MHRAPTVFVPPNSSYKNVDTKRIPRLHRFVWKGKIGKAMHYLATPGKQDKVKQRDYFGRTALHLAASCGDFHILQVLLALTKEDVDVKDRNGETAFFKAVQRWSMECMKELLSSGCDINVKNKMECTPVETLIISCGDECLPCFEYLVQASDIEKCYKNGMTLLHMASLYNRDLMCKSLIRFGYDLDAVDDQGRTSLMLAAENSLDSTYQLLLKNGASATVADSRGKDWKHYIQRNSLCSVLLQEAGEKFQRKGNTDLESSPQKLKSALLEDQGAIKSSLVIDHRSIRETLIRLQEDCGKHTEDLCQEEEKHKTLTSQINELEKSAERMESSVKCENSSQNRGFSRSKKSYNNREEWSRNFNQLVDQYDELQHAYEKLLMVETEKELELENKMEELRLKELEVDSCQGEIRCLEKELNSIKQNVDCSLNEKTSLKKEIEALRKSIPKEQAKLRDETRQLNQEKQKRRAQLDKIQDENNRKKMKFENLNSEKKRLLQCVKMKKHELEKENEDYTKLVGECNSLRERYEEIQNSSQ